MKIIEIFFHFAIIFFQKHSIYSISRKKMTQRNVVIMEFSNLSTQYNQINADVIASITKENTNSAKSNISSVYNSSALNLDAAVLSISNKGTAKMNAMLSKSIQLRANAADPKLTTSDRREVSDELREIRKEIEELRSESKAKKAEPKKTEHAKSADKTNAKTAVETEDVELNPAEAEKMMAKSRENILKQADDSLQTQHLNRERILQLL